MSRIGRELQFRQLLQKTPGAVAWKNRDRMHDTQPLHGDGVRGLLRLVGKLRRGRRRWEDATPVKVD